LIKILNLQEITVRSKSLYNTMRGKPKEAGTRFTFSGIKKPQQSFSPKLLNPQKGRRTGWREMAGD
jgi:hypothetical protein